MLSSSLLLQEIVISTIEENASANADADDSNAMTTEANEDFIKQILDDSDSQHLVQITVGSDGDQIGEVDLTGYVIE